MTICKTETDLDKESELSRTVLHHVVQPRLFPSLGIGHSGI